MLSLCYRLLDNYISSIFSQVTSRSAGDNVMRAVKVELEYLLLNQKFPRVSYFYFVKYPDASMHKGHHLDEVL
jgi:hypothetical protein